MVVVVVVVAVVAVVIMVGIMVVLPGSSSNRTLVRRSRPSEVPYL